MSGWRRAEVWWLLCAACRGAESASFEVPSTTGAGGADDAPVQEPPAAVGHAGAPGPATDDEARLGGAPPGPGSCQAQAVTLQEVHGRRVRGGVPIAIRGLVASTQKFLVSEAKSGSCLWGAVVSDPAVVGAGSGLMLVSFGEPHLEGVACRPGTDGLPDDLAPGDVCDVQGVVDTYVPSACPETAAALQVRVAASCPLQRRGAGTTPPPAVIDVRLADELARGEDPELLHAWGGALVQLQQLSALADPQDGDAVFPFGVVHFAETSLTMSSRVHFFDLSAGGPRAAGKAPHYDYPATFRSVSGVVMLDYCTWVLGPRTLQAAGP